MNKQRVLIVSAHLDDFELGMGGTAAKICKRSDVSLIVLCKGDRPGNESVVNHRKETCLKNCSSIGMCNISHYDYSDTYLDQIPQTELCNIIYKEVTTFNPTVVYTHHSGDVHNDHRITSNITRVACRMRRGSSVKELFEYTIPGSTEWGFMKNQTFNSYEDISETAEQKMSMISRYTTELRETPDPISLQMIEARDMYHGSLCGYSKAEIFNLIYRR